ncbi:hypothetical protein [Gordonia sp. (in: high G+C Gram-positive bacteria)]|uniref:DUF7171 family protein n=1 Tax=Gordonia sp. (in: high G+C Gram-positive bacteria) TaxID=84139 RepID=UPI0033402307
MAKVTKMNGEGGTTAGMFHHKYSGGGTDQFEFPSGDPHNHIGSTFTMTVQVELKAVVSDRISEGPREILQFKVVNSAPPKFVSKGDGVDPNQTSIDDVPDRESGEYGDYTPPAYDEHAHEGYPPEADNEGVEFDDPESGDETSVHSTPFLVKDA